MQLISSSPAQLPGTASDAPSRQPAVQPAARAQQAAPLSGSTLLALGQGETSAMGGPPSAGTAGSTAGSNTTVDTPRGMHSAGDRAVARPDVEQNRQTAGAADGLASQGSVACQTGTHGMQLADFMPGAVHSCMQLMMHLALDVATIAEAWRLARTVPAYRCYLC